MGRVLDRDAGDPGLDGRGYVLAHGLWLGGIAILEVGVDRHVHRANQRAQVLQHCIQ